MSESTGPDSGGLQAEAVQGGPAVHITVVPGDGVRQFGALSVDVTPDADGAVDVLVPERTVKAWAANIAWSEQSPVVPSPPPVPVEVPKEAVAALNAVLERWLDLNPSGLARALGRAAYPLIAARVRAEERERIAAAIRALPLRFPPDNNGYRHPKMLDQIREDAACLAAGVAVPVATPGPAEIASLPLEELPDWTDLAEAVGATLRNHEIGCSGEQETVMHWPDGRTAGYRDRLAIISGDSELPDYSKPPVATPTEPGRPLRVMEAHKLEDCTDPSTCWWSPHRMGERLQIDPAE